MKQVDFLEMSLQVQWDSFKISYNKFAGKANVASQDNVGLGAPCLGNWPVKMSLLVREMWVMRSIQITTSTTKEDYLEAELLPAYRCGKHCKLTKR